MDIEPVGHRYGFLIVRDVGGLRHALRPGAVLAVSECEHDGSECLVVLATGRLLQAAAPLEAIVASLAEAWSWARGRRSAAREPFGNGE